MRVFVGGSKTLRELSGAARALLRSHMDGGAELVVGDCVGADALAQRLLAEEGYREVEVCATAGAIRRNEGDWPVREVPVERRPNRRNADDGYLAHLAKDQAMALAADRGLMAWDGRSVGTLVNLLNLVSLICPEPCQATMRFHSEKSLETPRPGNALADAPRE